MKILNVRTEERALGTLGESLAAKHLKNQGYKILEKNYVAEGDEIDIIAQKDDIIAFIEVKTRTYKGDGKLDIRPSSAVTPEKQRKIIKTAKIYYAFTDHTRALRLDVIEVLLDKDKRPIEINHIEGAFNFNTAQKGGKRK